MSQDQSLESIREILVPNGEGNPIAATVVDIDREKQVAWIKLEGYACRVSIPLCDLRGMLKDIH